MEPVQRYGDAREHVPQRIAAGEMGHLVREDLDTTWELATLRDLRGTGRPIALRRFIMAVRVHASNQEREDKVHRSG
jgi:hypothetical protein